jgi:hypothetical protein
MHTFQKQARIAMFKCSLRYAQISPSTITTWELTGSQLLRLRAIKKMTSHINALHHLFSNV